MSTIAKKYLIANWKMHKTRQEVQPFIQGLLARARPNQQVHLCIAPAFIHLPLIRQIDPGHTLELAAQNCHHSSQGAFTGEVSAAMLHSYETKWVLVGHSERRTLYQEDSPLLAQKVKAVLASGMQPIFCCGESLADRKQENHHLAIAQQLIEGLTDLKPTDLDKLIIAYEPIWAIGTGQVADVATIEEMHRHIRQLMVKQYGQQGNVPIVYGGSCNPSNAKAIFACENVSGGLIGGASLDLDHFLSIIRALEASL